jgi:hypothetical protein
VEFPFTADLLVEEAGTQDGIHTAAEGLVKLITDRADELSAVGLAKEHQIAFHEGSRTAQDTGGALIFLACDLGGTILKQVRFRARRQAQL